MSTPEQPAAAGKDPSLAHVLPQAVEAEERLLCALMIDNSLLFDVLEILQPEDFYRPAHQKIFDAVVDLFEKSEPVDLITLTQALKQKGHLEKAGGASYLSRLIDTVPAAANARQYARIIHDKAALRRLIQKAGAITQRCYEDMGSVDEIIDFAESAIFEISENKTRQAFTPISKIILHNIDTLEERQDKRALITGVPSGFTRLDSLTAGFQKSDLIILAARPSMGKTALALNIARHAAVEENIPVAIFSLEMAKEQLSLRMLCSEASVDSMRLRGGFFNDEEWNLITDAASTLSEAPLYIDDTPSISVLEIRTKARRLKMDKGLELIIIDYLQLMQARRSSERRELEVSEISRALKALAKELNVPVIALSQLNRMLEQRSDKRPQLSDLRESGALEQDADVVAFIYRDEVYNKDENNPRRGTAEILLKKQRNGPTGEVTLAFLGAYTRFENLEEFHQP